MTLVFNIRTLRPNLRSMTCNVLVEVSLVIDLVDDVPQTPSSRSLATTLTFQRADAESIAEEELLIKGC